jgi:hypothetical protein
MDRHEKLLNECRQAQQFLEWTFRFVGVLHEVEGIVEVVRRVADGALEKPDRNLEQYELALAAIRSDLEYAARRIRNLMRAGQPDDVAAEIRFDRITPE